MQTTCTWSYPYREESLMRVTNTPMQKSNFGRASCRRSMRSQRHPSYAWRVKVKKKNCGYIGGLICASGRTTEYESSHTTHRFYKGKETQFSDSRGTSQDHMVLHLQDRRNWYKRAKQNLLYQEEHNVIKSQTAEMARP